MNIEIRLMDYKSAVHQKFLKSMMHEAIFVPEGQARPSLELLELPEIKKYYYEFGSKQDDICCIAFDASKGKMAGAVWARKFEKENAGYGFVDSSIPEISIAVINDYRGMGIGRKLIEYIIKITPEHIKALSLSVDIENRAYQLYKTLGFTDASIKDGTAIMVLKINQES